MTENRKRKWIDESDEEDELTSSDEIQSSDNEGSTTDEPCSNSSDDSDLEFIQFKKVVIDTSKNTTHEVPAYCETRFCQRPDCME